MELKTSPYYFSAHELFEGLNKKILKNKHIKNKKLLAAKIFTECFYEILLDIINNNITFVMPLRFGNYGEICMKQISGDKFKEVYKAGKFRNLDYVLSQFTGNQLVYKCTKRTGTITEKPIYVNQTLNKLITKYTYEGKQYY